MKFDGILEWLPEKRVDGKPRGTKPLPQSVLAKISDELAAKLRSHLLYIYMHACILVFPCVRAICIILTLVVVLAMIQWFVLIQMNKAPQTLPSTPCIEIGETDIRNFHISLQCLQVWSVALGHAVYQSFFSFWVQWRSLSMPTRPDLLLVVCNYPT